MLFYLKSSVYQGGIFNWRHFFNWMSSIKSKYVLRRNCWLINAPKSYTAAGNMRSLGYAMVLQWISKKVGFKFKWKLVLLKTVASHPQNWLILTISWDTVSAQLSFSMKYNPMIQLKIMIYSRRMATRLKLRPFRKWRRNWTWSIAFFIYYCKFFI